MRETERDRAFLLENAEKMQGLRAIRGERQKTIYATSKREKTLFFTSSKIRARCVCKVDDHRLNAIADAWPQLSERHKTIDASVVLRSV